VIHCDFRERAGGVPDLLAKAGCQLDFVQLPVGDYIIAERILVERKSASDLDVSIKNRRLFEQMARASRSYEKVILIVEAGWGSLPAIGRVGALARVLREHANVSIVQVADRNELAMWIVRLDKQETGQVSPGRSVLDPTLRKRRLSDDQLRERMLAHLPGVGAKAARALLDAHGSIANLAALDIKQLRKVEGIGKVRAQRVYEIFHGERAEVDEDLI
jgi:ERCC4-type nuclease